MSNITANNQTYELVKQVETASFEMHANYSLYPTAYNDGSAIINKLFDFYVKRNFKDDTFTMAWPDVVFNNQSNTYLNSENFSASSNNKVTVGPTTGIVVSKDEAGSTREARHFTLNDIKFRDVTSWSKSIISSSTPSSAIVSIFPTFSFFNKEINLNVNQALEIDLIHDISFRADPLTYVREESHDYSQFMKSYITYSHFFIVPRQIDQFKHQVTIADIYKMDDKDYRNNGNVNESSYLHEYNFSQIKYSSSSQKTQLDGYVQDEFGTSPQVSLSDFQNANNIYKIGSLNIADQTFYNYDNNKVEVGFGGDAQIGDLVPYNFDGDFNQKFNLGFIDFLKDYQIGVSSKFNQKALDPYSGRIKLNLASSNTSSLLDSQKITFSGKQLQEFRDTTKDVGFIALEGLKRFAHEQSN